MRISREGNAIQSKKLYIVYDLRISLRSPIHIHVYIVASIFSFRRKSDISYLEERERKKKREVLCTHDICRITYLYTEKHASHRNKIRCSLQDSYDL